MAEDIRVTCDMLHHHKIKLVKRHYGHKGIVAVLALWLYAGEHAQDGVIDVREDALLMIMDLDSGDEDNQGFVAFLVDQGLLNEREGGGWSIHNWEERQPWVLVRRRKREAGKKGAQVRWGDDQPARAAAPSLSRDSNKHKSNQQDSSKVMAVPVADRCRSKKVPMPPSHPIPSHPIPSLSEAREEAALSLGVELLELARESVKDLDPEQKAWDNGMRQVLARASPDEVRAVLGVVREDSFWRPKVLSPGDLLKHLDRLRAIAAQGGDLPQDTGGMSLEECDRLLKMGRIEPAGADQKRTQAERKNRPDGTKAGRKVERREARE